MTELLIQIIFGWPFIILSLLVSVMGLITKHYWLLLIGAVLIIPFTFYLSGAPSIRSIVYILPFFQVGAAVAVPKRKMLLAWMLTLPVFLVSAWMAFLVLTQ